MERIGVSPTNTGEGDGEDSHAPGDFAQPPLFDATDDATENLYVEAGDDAGDGTFGDIWESGGDEIIDSDPIATQSPGEPSTTPVAAQVTEAIVSSDEVTVGKKRRGRFSWLRAQRSPYEASEQPDVAVPPDSGLPDRLTRIPIISVATPTGTATEAESDDEEGRSEEAVATAGEQDVEATKSASEETGQLSAAEEAQVDVFDIDAEDPPSTDLTPDDSAPDTDPDVDSPESPEPVGTRISSALRVVHPSPTDDGPEPAEVYSVDAFDDFATDFEDLIEPDPQNEPTEDLRDPSGNLLAQWPEANVVQASTDPTRGLLDGVLPRQPQVSLADDSMFEAPVGSQDPHASDEGGTDDVATAANEPGGPSPQSHAPTSSYEYVDADDGDPVDFASLSSDEYLQAATSEHAGLAAAIAQSADEDREHAALHAALPGREDDIVGLDDVVDMTMEHDEVELATPRSRSDIAARVATGVGLVGAVALALMNPVAMGILAMLALGLAALEFYTALQRAGARPVTWVGLLAIAGSFLGTWLYGLVAVPIATILGLMAAAWFLSFKPKWPRPGVNLSFTVLGSAWIGGSGAFLFAILKSPDYRVLIAVIIGMVTVFDVAQYFSGRAFGKRQLSPIVSPKKTIAGLVGGYFAMAAAGFGLSRFDLWEPKTAFALVVAIGFVAPLGDLAVSVIKRALRIKDMGVVLPGHGGVLDRIDALLFAIPAAWVVFRWAGLV